MTRSEKVATAKALREQGLTLREIGERMGCLQWSEEQIVEAIRLWAREHNGRPPTCTEWRMSGETHPSAGTCCKRFGWNELLLKAGFDLRIDRRPETQAEIERLVSEGVSTKEIAERYGWTTANVHKRLRYRGTSVTELRSAA